MWDTLSSKIFKTLLPKSWPYQATVCFKLPLFFSEMNSKDSRDSTTVSDLHRGQTLKILSHSRWMYPLVPLLCNIIFQKSSTRMPVKGVPVERVKPLGLLHTKGPFCPCNIIYQKSSTRMPVRGVSVQRVRPWGYYIEKVPFVLVIPSTNLLRYSL